MILYYISSSPLPSKQANSVHVMNMCQAFAENGLDVVLFARRGERPHDYKEIFSYYGVFHDFKLSLHSHCSFKGVWNLSYTRKLMTAIKKEGLPDVFYGRYLYGLACLSLKFTNIPVIYEAHTLPEGRLHKNIESWLFKRPNFKKLVVISKALKDDYLREFPFLKDAQIAVAHDGANIPEPAEQEGKKLLGKTGIVKVLYSGRLTEGKGMGLIASLIPLCPEAEFHIFGGTENEVRGWKNKVECPNAFFYGHVPHSEMSGYYKQADIMLAPLQEKNILAGNYDIGRWTSPLKVFEYMSFGKPIVASKITVLEEILKDSKNSLLVNPKDPAAWKKAMDEIIKNKELANELGQNALEDFKENYTWQIRARKVLE